MKSNKLSSTSSKFHIGVFDPDSLLVRLAGIVALLSIPFKDLPDDIDTILPFDPDFTSNFVSFFVGIALLYIASQLQRRKYSAYILAVISMAVIVGAELLYFRNPLQIALYAATLTSIVKDRRKYVVRSDMVSLRQGLITSATILIVVLVFFLSVFTVIDHYKFGRHLRTSETLSLTYHALINNTLPDYVSPTRTDRFLVDILRVGSLTAVAVIGFSLFQPLRNRRPSLQRYRDQAAAILKEYGTSSEDYFKLWPEDKHYFFYKQAFIAYKVVNSNSFVIDGAAGRPEDLTPCREAFIDYAYNNGWYISIIHATAQESLAWQALDFRQLFIGSEAMIDVEDFMRDNTCNKHFRYVRNRAKTENLKFEIWQPPLSAQQLSSLRKISDQWLQSGNRREYTFIMGYFSEEYLEKCQVAVLRQKNELIAYTNLIPCFVDQTASVDHMRAVPGLSNVSIHYLLMETINYLHKQEIKSFNLGLAPLSKLDQFAETPAEKLLSVLKRLGRRYYSFDGLEQFKGKFTPDWEPRYLLYRGSSHRLVTVAASLVSATGKKGRHGKKL